MPLPWPCTSFSPRRGLLGSPGNLVLIGLSVISMRTDGPACGFCSSLAEDFASLRPCFEVQSPSGCFVLEAAVRKPAVICNSKRSREPRMPTMSETDTKTLDSLERTGERLIKVKEAIGQIIFGQEKVIELTLTAILSGGH